MTSFASPQSSFEEPAPNQEKPLMLTSLAAEYSYSIASGSSFRCGNLEVLEGRPEMLWELNLYSSVVQWYVEHDNGAWRSDIAP